MKINAETNARQLGQERMQQEQEQPSLRSQSRELQSPSVQACRPEKTGSLKGGTGVNMNIGKK